MLDRASQAPGRMLQVEDDGRGRLPAGEAGVPSDHVSPLLKQPADVQCDIDELQTQTILFISTILQSSGSSWSQDKRAESHLAKPDHVVIPSSDMGRSAIVIRKAWGSNKVVKAASIELI